MKLKLLCIALFISGISTAQGFKELSDSLLYYYQDKNYSKATPFAEQLLELVKNSYGRENKNYSSFLNLLGGIYFSDLEYAKAEKAFTELREINQKLYGVNSAEYIKGITLLSVIYNQTGRDRLTIPLLVESMNYYKSASGDSSSDYAAAANRLAKVYADNGEYEKALPLSETASAITKKEKGVNSEEFATIINNQGLIHKNMGHPEKAEPLLLQGAAIRKKIAGENAPDYANSLNNLATLYTDLGQDNKAFDHYERAAAIYKKAKGETSVEYLTCRINLGAAYADLGAFESAEKIYLEVENLAKKKYDESWPIRQEMVHKLGQLYMEMDQFEKAEPLIIKNTESEKNKNSNSLDYALALNDLAYLYSCTGRNDRAEQLYTESAAITKASLGEGHRDYAIALNNLALLYQEEKRYAEAIAAMNKVTATELDYFLKLFSILSASEKQAYIQRIEFVQNSNLSCLYRFPAAPASFYIDNYNTQLFLKSLLLTDNQHMLSSIRQSTDTVLKSVFENWQENKKELASQYSLPENERKKELPALEKETEEAEKELVRRSAAFRDFRSGLQIKMEEVQSKLNEGEAAIEFVNFHLVTTTRSDSSLYAALLLRKQDSIPVFVSLFEEKQLLNLMGRSGGTSGAIVNNLYPGKTITQPAAASQKLYELVWKPLEKYLEGINTIKFAPAGLLNKIAFHAISVNSEKLLQDKYQLQQYVSTREIVMAESSSSIPTSAVLIGDADFSTAAPGTIGVAWKKLPGTGKEIADIKKQFDEKKINTTIRTGKEASEETVKQMDGHAPQMVYIATHGFFLPDTKNDDRTATSYGKSVLSNASNPLLRSGLVLTGGNEAWLGSIPVAGKEDGILTALEVSQLNLSNTDLVVLSACETGLGDVKGTEGVFGLQRAFKLAGVKNLIVSLWKVPDKETAEMMIIMSQHLLAGEPVRASLTAARTEMQKKYSPFYWAAFILVE